MLHNTNKLNTTLIVESVELDPNEAALTDPKTIEMLIKKYENTQSGKDKDPLLDKTTKKPLDPAYCAEKIKLLKQKLNELRKNKPETPGDKKTSDKKAGGKKTDGKKPEDKPVTPDGKKPEPEDKKTEDKKPEDKQSIAAHIISILLNDLKWKQVDKNKFERKTKKNEYILELHTSINESIKNSSFKNYAYLIIEEHTNVIPAVLTIINIETKKTKTFDLQIPANIDKDTLQKLITAKSNTANLPDKSDKSDKSEKEPELFEKEKLQKFITAWNKLDENEQDAFETFYGDKLIAAIKKLGLD